MFNEKRRVCWNSHSIFRNYGGHIYTCFIWKFIMERMVKIAAYRILSMDGLIDWLVGWLVASRPSSSWWSATASLLLLLSFLHQSHKDMPWAVFLLLLHCIPLFLLHVDVWSTYRSIFSMGLIGRKRLKSRILLVRCALVERKMDEDEDSSSQEMYLLEIS